jgi:hypothetical protein
MHTAIFPGRTNRLPGKLVVVGFHDPQREACRAVAISFTLAVDKIIG